MTYDEWLEHHRKNFYPMIVAYMLKNQKEASEYLNKLQDCGKK